MKKRGQSTQQVFIFILAIIIVGIILLAGYTSIKRSSEKQEQALETFLVRSLKNTIASVSPNYAAMKIKEFETPSRYSEICFIDTNDPSEHSSEFLDNYPLIEDALETENNAFLIGKRFNSFDVGKLLLDNHAICINISTLEHLSVWAIMFIRIMSNISALILEQQALPVLPILHSN